jgi:hypothetical protein
MLVGSSSGRRQEAIVKKTKELKRHSDKRRQGTWRIHAGPGCDRIYRPIRKS